MPNRVCVIDMPGLSRALAAHIPATSALGQWLSSHPISSLTPSFPAVTCSVQATLTTGTHPSQHGIIANGIPTIRSADDAALVDAANFAAYRKQISFWEQSNQFLESRRFWQNADGTSKYKTALLFFQNSMPGFSGALKPAADIVLTPKPDHGPDGKLTSLCWSQPADIVPQLFKQLGPFPLMNYWGPVAGIAASQWIAKASAWIWSTHQPQLQWVYIPHLDYDLQRFGPDAPQARKAVEDLAAAVEPLVRQVLDSGGKLVALSEYAIGSARRAVYPNRILAEAQLLKTRSGEDGNLIDYANSTAFAMVDHQIAHVYVRDEQSLGAVRDILQRVEGIGNVLDKSAMAKMNCDHRRSGDLILEAADGTWLAYPWWENIEDAPVFAGAVDIHRKPGYDPQELFWDRAANRVSFDDTLVQGSHGLAHAGEAILAADASLPPSAHAVDVAGVIERMII